MGFVPAIVGKAARSREYAILVSLILGVEFEGDSLRNPLNHASQEAFELDEICLGSLKLTERVSKEDTTRLWGSGGRRGESSSIDIYVSIGHPIPG